MSGLESEYSGNFMTTRWSLIGALGTDDDRSREVAEELSRRYWSPVYAYLRRHGLHDDDAREIAQGFFADVVIGRNLFSRAEPDRGRLRTLILTALDRYRIDQYRRGERRLDTHAPALDETGSADPNATDPAGVFDREWAAAQLNEALDRARKHFMSNDREQHWQAFERYVLRPISAGVSRPSTAALADELGFRSAASLVSALQVVRTRVLAMLRTVIAESVGSGDELEQEYEHTVRLLGV